MVKARSEVFMRNIGVDRLEEYLSKFISDLAHARYLAQEIIGEVSSYNMFGRVLTVDNTTLFKYKGMYPADTLIPTACFKFPTRDLYIPDIMVEDINRELSLGDKVEVWHPSKKEVTNFLSHYLDFDDPRSGFINDVKAFLDYRSGKITQAELNSVPNEYVITDIKHDYFYGYPEKIANLKAYTLYSLYKLFLIVPSIYIGEKIRISTNSVNVDPVGICPICGQPGEDLVFKFYCSDPKCQNFKR